MNNRAASAQADAVKTVNVMMAGVGGQGVLMVSETLALAAIAQGMLAKQSEVHGVAQRGGSVVSHVRFGSTIHSPLIKCGEADVLYAVERLEALRYAHYVKRGGLVVMDDHGIKPIHVPDEPELPFPDGVPDFLRSKGYSVHVIPALHTAIEVGNRRCANIVLLGALSTQLPLDDRSWEKALLERFPEKLLGINKRAFEAGRRLALQTRD